MLTYSMIKTILDDADKIEPQDAIEYLFAVIVAIVVIPVDLILLPIEIIAGIMYLIHKIMNRKRGKI